MHLVVAKQSRQAQVPGGFAGIVANLIRRCGGVTQPASRKQMHLVETLQLGPRKQLFLVSCRGERFLVGSGAESVQSIVPVRSFKATATGVRTAGEDLC